jgi:glycosyltransferase involved in cell wall biosynthesis
MPPEFPVGVSFVIDNLSRAGTETQLLALIAGLDRRRVTPTLVLLDGRGDESRRLEPADCPTIRLGVTKLLGRDAFRAARRLRNFWRAFPPAVEACYFLDSAYFAVPVARLCGVPKVVRIRNNLGYWLTRKHRLLNRLARPWVDAVLTNSAGGRQALIDGDGLDPAMVTVVENGVDLDRFAGGPPPLSRPGVKRIGCVANLRPVKNIDGLLRVAKLVLERHPDATFEVAGDGPERARLEALHADLGLGDRFAFRGAVADVPAFLRGVDVAVLPSHSEGMSNALLEALAAGRALVVTDTGANAQLVADGERGRVVPVGNDIALVDALVDVLGDPVTAQRYGDAGRDFVATNYGRAAMVCRFEDFFTEQAKDALPERRMLVRRGSAPIPSAARAV